MNSHIEFALPGFSEGITERTRTPTVLIWAVVSVCIAPFLLTVLGFDFGSYPPPFDINAAPSLNNGELLDAMFYSMSGAFTHTVLEWSAFCTAIFTVILAFSHYRMTGDVTTPIIGMALFCSGCMDAFHTLAADRLIEAVADNHDLIPFTWAISRVFNAIIMIFGVGVLLSSHDRNWKADTKLIALISMLFGLFSYGIIHYCANSTNLPQTMYPDAILTRPWDVAPLILFLFAGLYVYPKFYRKYPSLFAHALLISVIPEIALEFHMAFGSTSLFDNHFNIAHFLKVIAYLVPFIGLVLGYIKTYKEEQTLVAILASNSKELTQQNLLIQTMNDDLQRSNHELEQFAYVASHDLQEPLRMVASYTQLLEKKYKGQLDDDADEFIGYAVDGAKRMQQLVQDLLLYSRVGTTQKEKTDVDCNQVLETAKSQLLMSIEEADASITQDTLPVIRGDAVQLTQLFQNLLGNALKYRSDLPVIIHFSVKRNNDEWIFAVEDNGVGFEEKFKERVFVIFQRLHTKESFQGTGIGLAICKKIVTQLNGKIWVESEPGKGSTFFFTLPVIKPDYEL